MISEFKKEKKQKGKKKSDSKHQQRNDKLTPPPEAKNYIDLIKQFYPVNSVVIVLDARNPHAHRYLSYEEFLIEKKKLVFVLNKIDLIPREAAIGWLRNLSTIGPTFAISTKYSALPLIEYFTECANKSPEPYSICVTGFAQVGKKSIAKFLSSINNVSVTISKSWNWFEVSSDLVALGSYPLSSITQNVISQARDFLCRCSIHSLMEMFKVPYFSSADVVFPIIEKGSNRSASLQLFSNLANNKYLYYTAPPCGNVADSCDDLSIAQREAIKISKPHDLIIEPIITLCYGTPNLLKKHILPYLHQLAEDKGTA